MAMLTGAHRLFLEESGRDRPTDRRRMDQVKLTALRLHRSLAGPAAVACALVMLLVSAVLTDAHAQFDRIFGNQAPLRPPAPIDEPLQEPEEDDVPDIPVGPGRVLPTPPGQVRRPGPVQTQPLAPPPGAEQAPETAAPANPDSIPGAQPPLTGLPPGQRQPRGDAPNTPSSSASVQPGDEVVVEPPSQKIVNQRAVFSGLDKITGRIINFDAAIGETVQFGALRVTPRACYTRPPTETANTDAFIEVDEITLKGEVKRIFSGWMFAASPGLHAVEHSIYDVWLTDCKKPEGEVANADGADRAGNGAPVPRRPPTPRARPRAQ